MRATIKGNLALLVILVVALALWLQVASVKLFGFQGLAMLLPQALMGVASVALLYHLVKRNFDVGTALVAALLFAIMPVAVAVNRTNNTDTALVLILLLAAWAMLKATEESSAKILILAMAVVGLAFNVKMLAGVLLLPVFVLIYLSMAKKPLRARIRDLIVSSVVLLLVSLSWVAVVQLTPADQRPYIGSSRSNSIFELILGHNAMNRLFSPGNLAAQNANKLTGAASPSDSAVAVQPAVTAQPPEPGVDTRSTIREVWLRMFVRSATGPQRLLGGQLAAQIAWFLPVLLFGLVAWASPKLGTSVPQTPSDDIKVVQLAHRRKISVCLWIGWLTTYWLIYSYLGGIIHFYYLVTLAPALAVLGALASVKLWALRGANRPIAWLLPVLPLVAVGWQFQVHMTAMGWPTLSSLWTQRESWLNAVHAVLMVSVIAALVALLVARARSGGSTSASARRLDGVALAATGAALLLLPTVWSLSSIWVAAPGILPSADLYRWQVLTRDPVAASFLRFGRLPDQTQLIEFLKRQRLVTPNSDSRSVSISGSKQSLRNDRFLLATSTTLWAAPMIILTGEAVLVRGGYHGLDLATTPKSLRQLVDQGQLRFAMVNDVLQLSRRLGADQAGSEVTIWIRAHGKLVDPSLWRSSATRGDAELYDLRPASQ